MSDKVYNIKNASYPTVVYHSKPLVNTSSSPSPLLVFVPGNPGLIGYYIEYLTSVQSLMPNFEILAISYAGFTYNDDENDNNEVIGLQSQANHKIEIVKKFVTEPRDIYWFCHSVGCYITQKVVLKLSDDQDPLLDQIKFIGFITPTISEIGLSKNGVRFAKFFEYIPKFHLIVSKIGYLTRLIPDFIIDKLIKNKLRTESVHPRLETKRLIQSTNLIAKSLGLAREELITINRDTSLSDQFFKIIKSTGIKFWGFFCHTDYWIHNDTRQKIIDQYSINTTNKFEIHDDVTLKHSFCIRSSDIFADITKNAIEELI